MKDIVVYRMIGSNSVQIRKTKTGYKVSVFGGKYSGVSFFFKDFDIAKSCMDVTARRMKNQNYIIPQEIIRRISAALLNKR